MVSEPPAGIELFCPECDYNLRGLTSDRCPECGLKLDFIDAPESPVPWERRAQLGRLRTYWQTVFLVLFRTKLFCRAMYRPVSYRAARRFQYVTVLHTLAALFLGLLSLQWQRPDLLQQLWLTGWPLVAVGAITGLALLALTGLPSYFFHPRWLPVELQNRAVALCYYANAPLAASALVPLASIAAYHAVGPPRDLQPVLVLVTAPLTVLVLLMWWSIWNQFAKYLLRRPTRVAVVTWLLPPLGLLLTAFLLAVPALVALYIALIVSSLR